MVIKIKDNFFYSTLESHLVYYAVPLNITSLWACGFCLGIVIGGQLLSGAFLAIHYEGSALKAFNSIQHILRNVNWGWLLKYTHSNFATGIFILVYLHIFRGLFYNVFITNYIVWLTGVVIFLLLMATAFFGYTLPWGQMSYWGSVVIINFSTAVPIMGVQVRDWVWGGSSINNKTVTRFMLFHYVFPLLVLTGAILHLYLLHSSWFGSSAPLTSVEFKEVVSFFPEFIFKDVLVLFGFLILIGHFITYNPDYFLDSVNFFKADAFKTPNVIKPEWYFLPFYAILRSVTFSKLCGVLVMVFSIFIFAIVPSIYDYDLTNDSLFREFQLFIFWLFFFNFLILGIIGLLPATFVTQKYGLVFTFLHFGFFVLSFIIFPLSNYYREHLWYKPKYKISRYLRY